jgi:hypothetical protein
VSAAVVGRRKSVERDPTHHDLDKRACEDPQHYPSTEPSQREKGKVNLYFVGCWIGPSDRASESKTKNNNIKHQTSLARETVTERETDTESESTSDKRSRSYLVLYQSCLGPDMASSLRRRMGIICTTNNETSAGDSMYPYLVTLLAIR